MKQLFMFFAAMLALSFPALAQEEGAIFDHDQRMALAEQMHEIKPAKIQLEAAIDAVARQRVAPDKRAAFKHTMLSLMDEDKLEQLSINAMAEIFTVAELQRMVDYFGSAEAQSIADKLPVYQALVTPELTKMIDSALLQIRTGDVQGK